MSTYRKKEARTIGEVDCREADGSVRKIPVDIVSDEEFERIWAKTDYTDAGSEAEVRVETGDTFEGGMHRDIKPDNIIDENDDRSVSRYRRNTQIAKDRFRAARAARSAFRWIGIFLPRRIRDEEIGDALEDIQKIIRDPNCPNVRRAVRWKIVSTSFWLVWHGVRHVSASIRGKKAE
jgi:hypothetical protein